MKKQETVNTFSDGITLDLNPLTVPNSTLTNCLNGTMLTFNGNENVLQNDMGNARVETAMLPTGYIPLGSTSFGGIIYIVSYNPIDKKCQIGSFPSPERNLTKDELGDNSKAVINLDQFCETSWNELEGQFGDPDNIITNYYQKVNLLETKIHAGDKYKIFSDQINELQEYISGWTENNTNPNKNPKYLKFDIVSTLDDGKIINLTDNSVWTINDKNEDKKSIPYYIYNGDISSDSTGKIDLEEYRGLVGSNYDTYVSKLSGKLGIVAKLEVPTTFSVGYEVLRNPYPDEIIEGYDTYQFYLTLNWTNDNTLDKSRINPIGAKIFVNNKPLIFSEEQDYFPIDLESFDIKEVDTEYQSNFSDTLIEDKCKTIAPDNYYLEGGKLEYLKNNYNYFDRNQLRGNDGTDFQYLIKAFKLYKKGKVFYQQNEDNSMTLLEDDYVYLYDGNNLNSLDKDKLYEFNNDTLTELNEDIIYEYDRDFSIVNDNYVSNLQRSVEEEKTTDVYLTITIIPVMSFGKLEFLKRTLVLNLSEINSGHMYLNNYQYYVESDKINIDFSLEAYPEEGKSINYLSISYQPLTDAINNDTSWLLQSTYEKETTKYVQISDSERVIDGNPSGLQHITIDRSKLEENKIYLIHFIVDYSGENRIFSRIFFNNTLFNNAFGQGKDFKDLYLYDPDQDYGINLNLQFNESLDKSYYVDDLEIKKYLDISETQNKNLTCSIINTVNQKFDLPINIQDLKIDFSLKNRQILNNTNYVNEVSDPNIVISNESGVNLKINNIDKSIDFSHRFNLKLPVTLDYSKMNALDQYELVKLKTDTSLHHRLEHESDNKVAGAFSLWKNYTNTVSGNYIKMIEYPVPDDLKDTNVFLDHINSELYDVLSKNKLDYLNVQFGVFEMEDQHCGYSFSVGDNVMYFRFNHHPTKQYVTITAIRKTQDETVLIHDNLSKLKNDKIQTSPIFYDKDQEPTEQNCVRTNVTLPMDRYYKYEKNPEKKILYTINNIDYIKDPTITSTYNLNLDFQKIYILINQIPIDNNNYVKNLIINKSDSIQTQISFKNSINTQSWINNIYSDDLNNNIFISNDINSDVFPTDVVYKVYTSGYGVFRNDNISSMFEISNDGYLQLIPDVKYSKTIWQFGWENTDGDHGQRIDKSKFYNSKQIYNLYDTYNISRE